MVVSCCPRRRGRLHTKRRKRGRHAWRRATDQLPCTCCRSVSSPSPLSSQPLITAVVGGAGACNSVRSRVVVLSCNTQAMRSVRTVASTLVTCLLRIWLRRSSCFIFLNTSSTCHLARYTYRTSATAQHGASSVVMRRSQPATVKVGAVMVRPAFWALRRFRCRARVVAAASRFAATNRTASRPPPPPPAFLPKPAQHVKGLGGRCFQGERGRVDADHHGRLLPHGGGHTA